MSACMADTTVPLPQWVIVILLGSLNPHLLGAYGGGEFNTPGLDRFSGVYGAFSGNHPYDRLDDPSEERNRTGSREETDAADQLRAALRLIEAPGDQFVHPGL